MDCGGVGPVDGLSYSRGWNVGWARQRAGVVLRSLACDGGVGSITCVARPGQWQWKEMVPGSSL